MRVNVNLRISTSWYVWWRVTYATVANWCPIGSTERSAELRSRHCIWKKKLEKKKYFYLFCALADTRIYTNLGSQEWLQWWQGTHRKLLLTFLLSKSITCESLKQVEFPTQTVGLYIVWNLLGNTIDLRAWNLIITFGMTIKLCFHAANYSW